MDSLICIVYIIEKDIVEVANKYIINAMAKDHSSKIIFGSSDNNLEGLLSKGIKIKFI